MDIFNDDNKYTVNLSKDNNLIIITNLTFNDAYKLCVPNEALQINNSWHVMMKLPMKKAIDSVASGSIILVAYKYNNKNYMIKQLKIN